MDFIKSAQNSKLIDIFSTLLIMNAGSIFQMNDSLYNKAINLYQYS